MTVEDKVDMKTVAVLKASKGEVVEVPLQVSTTKPSNVAVKELLPNDPNLSLELDNIIQTLRGLGINVCSLGYGKDFYPGDLYVFSNDRYIPESHFGGLGQGGFVVPSNGFVLVGEKAIKYSSCIEEGIKFGHYLDKEERTKFKEFAKKLYRVEEVYLMPAVEIFRIRRDEVYEHIDLFNGSIPEASILSVNRSYYEGNKKIFDEIKERFKPDIIVTKPNGFENNYRTVYNKEGELFVIVNKEANDLIGNLVDRGLNVVPVSIGNFILRGVASIHCVTNVFHNIETLELIAQLSSKSLRITSYDKHNT